VIGATFFILGVLP